MAGAYGPVRGSPERAREDWDRVLWTTLLGWAPPALEIAAATAADFPRIAELTVAVYTAEDLVSPGYVPELADVAGRADRAELLVARDGDGHVVGSVALALDGDFGEVTDGDDEAAFRMLAVDGRTRGQGIGEALVRACLDRARAAGKRRMVLSTEVRM